MLLLGHPCGARCVPFATFSQGDKDLTDRKQILPFVFRILANVEAEMRDDALEELSLIRIGWVVSPRSVPKSVAEPAYDVDLVVAFDVRAIVNRFGNESIRL
jgi:hypothetical protein